MTAQLFLGLISGTSMDGVDAVLAELDDSSCHVRHAVTTPYPQHLARRLHDVLAARQASLQELGGLDVALGHFFAECALGLLAAADCRPDDVTAIGHHGQTLFHAPDSTEPFTLQIGDANVVAARTGITTIADFRRMDVAFGGQGAPLVPAFHHWWLHSDSQTRVVLNLGGIANVTVLDACGTVTGFDTGPANTLLDSWARRHLNQPFDEHGRWARSGQVDPTLLDALLADPYFARPWPKSTGPEYFNLEWLDRVLRSSTSAVPAAGDVQATLAELTAASVAGAIAASAATCRRVVVCGGGAHNQDLMARVSRQLAQAVGEQTVVESSLAHGVAPDWVEGAAFAWLARQRLLGLPGNVTGVTGAREAVTLGGVYCPDHGHSASSRLAPGSGT